MLKSYNFNYVDVGNAHCINAGKPYMLQDQKGQIKSRINIEISETN